DGGAGYPLHEPEPGRAEQDAGQVLDAAVRGLREAAAAAREVGARSGGVSISTAMPALVGAGRDGRAVTPVVTWADTRAADQAERLRSEHPDLHGRTGTPAHPRPLRPRRMWFREQEPETFAAVARWGGLKELVLERLAGTWACDHSCASGTGLMALEDLDWDAEALDLAGVGADRLARLVPVTERFELTREAAEATGLDAGLPDVAGGGDGPLANLGGGAVPPGVAACSVAPSGR